MRFIVMFVTAVCVLFLIKLYKFGWHTSANNAGMKKSKDLILGEVVYISIIYRISDSWLNSLNGYGF